jgi:hypothetical protein
MASRDLWGWPKALVLRPLVNALSMATRRIHGDQFPSYCAKAVCLRLRTIRLEEVFPPLRGGRRPAIRPGSGSQGDAYDDRERKFLFHK